MKVPCVYMLASKPHGTLYIGVTSDLYKRMAEHEQGLIAGFTRRYRVKELVYYEMLETMLAAIAREKQLKRWNRLWKIRLIEQMNPQWQNLYDAATGEVACGPAEADRLGADPLPQAGMDGSPPKAGMT